MVTTKGPWASALRAVAVATIVAGGGWMPAATASQEGQRPGSVAEDPTAALFRAYRSGVYAERSQIELTDESGPARRAEYVIRFAAADASAGLPRRLSLELSELNLWIEGDKAIATLRTRPDRYAVFTLPPVALVQALRPFMPSLVLAQLSLLDERSGDRPSLLPELWSPSELEADGIDRTTGFVRLIARSPEGALRVRVDRATGRLRSVSKALSDAATAGPQLGPRAVEISVRPTDAGDPAKWKPNLEGRTRVASLGELQPDTDLLRPGERLPASLFFRDRNVERWGPTDDQGAVLIFFRPDLAGLALPDAEARDRAARAMQSSSEPVVELARLLQPAEGDRYVVRQIALLTYQEHTFRQMDMLENVLSIERAAGQRRSRGVLFAVHDTDLWEMICGSGTSGAVVLDRSHVVRAIVTLDDPQRAANTIRAVLAQIK